MLSNLLACIHDSAEQNWLQGLAGQLVACQDMQSWHVLTDRAVGEAPEAD